MLGAPKHQVFGGMPDYIQNMNRTQGQPALKAPSDRGFFGRFANILMGGEYGDEKMGWVERLGRGADGMNAYRDQMKEQELFMLAQQQAEEAEKARRYQLNVDATLAGFKGRDRAAFLANPEKFGEEYAKNYAPQSFTAGNTYSMRGGPMQRAPMPNKTTTNALGQPVTIDPNTGGQVGQSIGPVKPMNVPDGADVFDPLTNQRIYENPKTQSGPLVQVNTGDAEAYGNNLLDPEQTKGNDPAVVFDANGRIVVSPNQQQSAFGADALKFNEMNAKFDLAEDEIDRAIAYIDGGASAGSMAWAKDIPIFGGQTPAGGLANSLKTIMARIGFDELQAMREASPTGGALGQVSEREIDFLQSLMGSLAQDQSPEVLRENLVTIRNFLRGRQSRYEEAFNTKYPTLEKSFDNRGNAMQSIDDEIAALERELGQ